VRRYHALLSAALQQAIKWDWIESNPARRASPPSEPRPKVSAPTPAELRQLIDGAAAVKPAHGILVAFAAITGARRGEVCGLRWSDIDLDAGTVRIWRSIRQVGQELIEGDTKTHQERSVALPAPAVASLQRYRAQIEKASADPFVFSPRPDHSTPYTPDAISRMFARVARDAGLPYHLHQLRHFAATQAIAAGFDAVSVAARLGHADPSVTLRVYSHSLEDRDRALGAALGELVIPGSTK
jgi:integrase